MEDCDRFCVRARSREAPWFDHAGSRGTSEDNFAFRDDIREDRSIALSKVLFESMHLRVTDDRDKIFALQGLASYIKDAPLTDYQKSLEETYTNMACYLLTARNDTQTLIWAGKGYERNLKDLPSWVPHWTRPPRYWVHGEVVRPSYNAAGNTVSHFWGRPNPRSIGCRGWILNRVGHLGPVLSYDFTDIVPLEFVWRVRDWRRSSLSLVQSCVRDPYKDGKPVSEALWRTLMTDRTTTERPAPKVYGRYAEYHAANLENVDSEEDLIRVYKERKNRIADRAAAQGPHLRSFWRQEERPEELGPLAVTPAELRDRDERLQKTFPDFYASYLDAPEHWTWWVVNKPTAEHSWRLPWEEECALVPMFHRSRAPRD